MEPDDDKTRTHVALTKDTMVGHYRIVEKIGAGGMGEVYLAISQYETFLDIWKDADAGIVEIEDAKERLAGLSRAS